MQAAGWGRVLAITSIAVRQPIPTLILSNTARAGFTGFVNSILPGLHDTERVQELYPDSGAVTTGIPAGRLGDPAAFGRVAAFLCSEPAAYLTGVALQIDGGTYAGLL